MPRPTSLLALLLALGACRGARPAADATAARPAASVTDAERARLAARAARVTIRRDDLGIPHIDAPTDADVVFGMMYAQAEDDFMRVERNYLVNLGRLAEAEGEGAVWSDVRARLWVDEDTLRAQYAQAPAELRALMDAWADGLNWYLATGTGAKPRAITRFEPWMTLAFTEGSIGGDIEGVSTAGLARLYGRCPDASGDRRGAAAARAGAIVASAASLVDAVRDSVPGGSNGIAIAPARTASGRALLLINPHTSHYFRSEARVTSGEGLDAYGASTWGQFFVYQGFNARLGWMHTSGGNDSVDEWLEAVPVDTTGGCVRVTRPVYRHGAGERPLVRRTVRIRVRQGDGTLAERAVETWATHHGPVTRLEHGKLVTTGLMWRPVDALRQSWGRTKARTLAEFRTVLDIGANSSNNTLYADADGNIAYFHVSFIPKRDPSRDWTKPQDGTDPAADWRGIHAYGDLPHVVNPARGWVYNTNNSPWSVVGEGSPRATDFPSYVDRVGENPRGLHALSVLGDQRGWTPASLHEAAYDPELTAFASLVPSLVAAYDALPAGDAQRAALEAPVALLRAWDRRTGTASEATTLAITWAEELGRQVMLARLPRPAPPLDIAMAAPPAMRLAALAAARDTLVARFGRWRMPWGEVNRFQRIVDSVEPQFDDSKPSLPVGMASARWGALASYDARRGTGTRKRYGTYGNSFVAVVEFGPRVQARAVMAGGQSGDPRSPHFADQAATYASGRLRAVYFHEDELRGHVVETYRPGARRR
jgi:acyl-homoserine-lactone acylase